MISIKDLCENNGALICEICKSRYKYTGGSFTKHIQKNHSLTCKEYYKTFIGNSESGFCKCGCGEETSWEARSGYFHDYITGHNYKGKNKYNDTSVLERTKKMICNQRWKDSIFKKNNIPWNKGLTLSNEKICRLIEKMKNTVKNRDKERTEKIYQKISKTAKENFRSGKRKSGFCLLTEQQKTESRKKAIKTMSENSTFPNCKRFKTGKYRSIKNNCDIIFASSYELERMKYYDECINVLSWSRCKDLIEYYCSEENKIKYYNPDFCLITDKGIVIEEIKGIITQKTIDKALAAKKYYENAGKQYNIIYKKKNSIFLENIKLEELESYKRKDKWLKTF